MSSIPKYREVMQAITHDIRSGKYQPGDRLPSEAALIRKFATSRITVNRAMREMQQAGLIDRIAGSGSYVRNNAELPSALLFGLLIPDLGETEILDPICHGISTAKEAEGHALLWGHGGTGEVSKAEQCWRLCQQFIARPVAGVFFAPLEFEAAARATNRKIMAALREARIPVVLLDRKFGVAHEPRVDVVGLNNHQAGFLATEHLIKLGCRRIGFVALQAAESSVQGRMAGYRDALRLYGLKADTQSVDDAEEWESGEDAEALVCLNDRTASLLMQAYLSRGIRIPEDIRLVGIDDVNYASMLPVPLTTIRQPCLEVGQAAMRTMLDRIMHPGAPAREILLDGELIIRQSCGADLPASGHGIIDVA